MCARAPSRIPQMPVIARQLSLRTWFFVLVLMAMLPVATIMVWSALHAREQRIHNAYAAVQTVDGVIALAHERLPESAR